MRKLFCTSLLFIGMAIGNANATTVVNSSQEPQKPSNEELEKQVTDNLKKLIEEHKVKVKIKSYHCNPRTKKCEIQFGLTTVE